MNYKKILLYLFVAQPYSIYPMPEWLTTLKNIAYAAHKGIFSSQPASGQSQAITPHKPTIPHSTSSNDNVLLSSESIQPIIEFPETDNTQSTLNVSEFTIPPTTGPTQIIINNTNNNLSTTATETITTLTAQQSNLQQQKTDLLFFGFDFLNPEHYKNALHTSKNRAQGYFSSFRQWLWHYKFQAALITGISTYALIQSYLLFLKFELFIDEPWSQWRGKTGHEQYLLAPLENITQEVMLDQLFTIPSNQLSEQLLIDIQSKYTQKNNLVDFATPLMRFLRDTDKEEFYLKRYKKSIAIIEKCRIKRFFYIDNNLAAEIPKRISKLSFLTKTFTNWLARYKLTHSYPTLHKALRKRLEALEDIS